MFVWMNPGWLENMGNISIWTNGRHNRMKPRASFSYIWESKGTFTKNETSKRPNWRQSSVVAEDPGGEREG